MKRNWFLIALLTVFLEGCATHRVNWTARIGTYTYDQAVLEYGPPDKQARLSDGRRVAEWISRYSTGGAVVIGTGFWNYPGGVGYLQSTGPQYYEDKLRLTFGTNNVLMGWSKN